MTTYAYNSTNHLVKPPKVDTAFVQSVLTDVKQAREAFQAASKHVEVMSEKQRRARVK